LETSKRERLIFLLAFYTVWLYLGLRVYYHPGEGGSAFIVTTEQLARLAGVLFWLRHGTTKPKQ